MSISPSEFVPYSEIPAEYRMAAAEIEAVVEAQSFLGMLDNGDGSGNTARTGRLRQKDAPPKSCYGSASATCAMRSPSPRSSTTTDASTGSRGIWGMKA